MEACVTNLQTGVERCTTYIYLNTTVTVPAPWTFWESVIFAVGLAAIALVGFKAICAIADWVIELYTAAKRINSESPENDCE
jgi:hypothetical protein